MSSIRAVTLAAAAGLGVGAWGFSTARSPASSVFLGIAAAVLVLTVWMLLRAARALVDEPAAEAERATGRRRKELEREKAALLKALKELEFDHEMGKISDADFREVGGQYLARAMRVLRQLDEAGADYRALVEREVRARLKSAAPDGKAPDGKAPDGKARAAAPARPACPRCATENDADAVFCKKCGHKFAGAEVAS